MTHDKTKISGKTKSDLRIHEVTFNEVPRTAILKPEKYTSPP